MERNLLGFHSFSRCDWLAAPSREFVENTQLDHESEISLFDTFAIFKSSHESIVVPKDRAPFCTKNRDLARSDFLPSMCRELVTT